MTRQIDIRGIIIRRAIAAVWFEVDREIHGQAGCPFRECPHSISLDDLLTILTRISPAPDTSDDGPPTLAN